MSRLPDESINLQNTTGDSGAENLYVYGKLNYDFEEDEITLKSLNVKGGINSNLTGDVTGNVNGVATLATGLSGNPSITTTGDITASVFNGNGANLVGISTVLQGFIVMWSGSVANIPTGYLLCDGSNGTPDLRDRFIVGAGSAYNPDDSGGNDNVTLSVAQLPSHSHGVTDPGHTHTYTRFANTQRVDNDETHQRLNSSTSDTTGNSTTGITIDNTGGGQAVDIRPKYYALCFIMKT